jgi:Tfp pilus assembly protein PilO
MPINKPLTIIIAALIVLLLGFFWVWPAYQSSSNLQASIVQKQAEYESKSAYYAKVDQTLAQIESKQESLQKVGSALPDDFTAGPVIDFIQQKAADAGLLVKLVVFSKISPSVTDKSPQTVGQKVRDINFTVNVSGNYQGLKSFLASLDNSSRLFEANSIFFRSPITDTQIKNQGSIYDFNLGLTARSY